MFLSLAWAYISDCDINSEALRWAGKARFDMWGAYRIMAIREYRGSLKFKGEKITQNKPSIIKSPEEYSEIINLEDLSVHHFLLTNVPWISTNFLAS